MTLFNFQDNNEDEFDDEFYGEAEEQECNCEKCSQLATVELVANFTDIMTQADSEEELLKIVCDLVEIAKVQGIKEYLFETIVAQTDVLDALSSVKVEYYDVEDDSDYGSNGDWVNRLGY